MMRRRRWLLIGGAVFLLGFLALRELVTLPQVRRLLAPVHDGVLLELHGALARHAPLSWLLLASVALAAAWVFLCAVLGVRSLQEFLRFFLAALTRADPRSRTLLAALRARARLARLLRLPARLRPGRLSRSYLAAALEALREEERRYHGGGEAAARRALAARLGGLGEAFAFCARSGDVWSVRPALYFLGEARALGEECPGECTVDLEAVEVLALSHVLPEGRPPSTAAVAAALEAPPPRSDLTALLLVLLHEEEREPDGALAACLRFRLEGHAARLLALARSLSLPGAPPPAEARARRRELEALAQHPLSSLDLAWLAPGFARLLERRRDLAGLTAWVEVLDELGGLLPGLERVPGAEPLLPRLLLDAGAGTPQPAGTGPAVRGALLRLEEADRPGGRRAVEERFAILAAG